MTYQEIKDLLNRLRAKKAKYSFNSTEGESGTFWVGNLEMIDLSDLILLKTYEFDIKEYFKYNTRDLM